MKGTREIKTPARVEFGETRAVSIPDILVLYNSDISDIIGLHLHASVRLVILWISIWQPSPCPELDPIDSSAAQSQKSCLAQRDLSASCRLLALAAAAATYNHSPSISWTVECLP